MSLADSIWHPIQLFGNSEQLPSIGDLCESRFEWARGALALKVVAAQAQL